MLVHPSLEPLLLFILLFVHQSSLYVSNSSAMFFLFPNNSIVRPSVYLLGNSRVSIGLSFSYSYILSSLDCLLAKTFSFNLVLHFFLPSQNTITLQPGMMRGTLLVKTENGQLQVVNVAPSLPPNSSATTIAGAPTYRLQSVQVGSLACAMLKAAACCKILFFL